MANYYETLLVPTNADNELLQQRYHQIRDSEGKWPVYPYYPLDLAYFLLAYQTLCNPVTRAAHDQEYNIVPQDASYRTCLQWTREQANENAGRGRTPGLHFAHIGIANLLDGGQIDFINGCEIRHSVDKRLVLITPDDDSEEMEPPYRIALPGCTADIALPHTLAIWWVNPNGESPRWSYKWNADTNEWYERPDSPLRSDQARSEYIPVNPPGFSGLREEDLLAPFLCPVCRALVAGETASKCPMCETNLRECPQCLRLIEYELETCPNCGG